MSTPNEARTALAMDALRGAMANLRVAIQLLGETQARPAEEEPEQSQGPAMFGRGASRPTAANGADSTTPQRG